MRELALAALILFAQDEEAWLRDLAGDDAIARDAAEQKLVEAGEGVMRRLEELAKTGELETRTRATRILAARARLARRKEALGGVVKVTIDVKEAPLEEAAAALEKASGFQLWFAKGVESRRITLSLTETPWLEAVARLCRAHGQIRTVDDSPGFQEWRDAQPSRRAHFAIGPGKAPDEPAVNVGPFRISLSELWLSRVRAGTPSFGIALRQRWQPNARPMGTVSTVWEYVLEGGGRDLVDARDRAALDEPLKETLPMRGVTPRSACELKTQPGADAETLSVKGRARLWFAIETSLRIENPGEAVGKSRPFGDFTLAVDSVRGDGKLTTYQLRATPREDYPFNKAVAADRLIELRWLDKDGKDVPPHWREGLLRQFAAGSEPVAVEARTWADPWLVEVPFEFKGVKLPRW